MNEYVKMMKEILGEEKYMELSNKLFKEVNKKYRRISIEKGISIAEFNMANILVIGIEKARGCKEEKLEKTVSWYELGSRTLLLEKKVKGFENNYSEYIELIVEKVTETVKNSNIKFFYND